MRHDNPKMSLFVIHEAKLPADHVITMLLAIGKATAAPWPRTGQVSLSDVMIENRF